MKAVRALDRPAAMGYGRWRQESVITTVNRALQDGG